MFVVSSFQSVECKKGKKWWQTDTKSLHCQPGTTPPKIHFRTSTLNTNTCFWSHERNTTKDTGEIHFLVTDRSYKVPPLPTRHHPTKNSLPQSSPHHILYCLNTNTSLRVNNLFVGYLLCWLLVTLQFMSLVREPESLENRDLESKMQDFRREVRIQQFVFAVLSPRPSVL